MRRTLCILLAALATTSLGCATIRESDTARTGIEQLLVSSAVDRSLDQVNFTPIRGAKVFVEPKFLDCVDKNYVLISLNQRVLANGATLVDKPEDADVVLQVGSGGVGTDRHDMFVGIPEIPLPPPSPIAIPKLALFNRSRANGTAKLTVIGIDTKTHVSVINSGHMLARSDYKNWKLLGGGSYETGSVQQELIAATRANQASQSPTFMASKPKFPSFTK